jgi:hypothetical protein
MIDKRFNLEDQRRFAALSGDYNPLHIDPIYSRRLMFGSPVVHGVHLVLYALERLLETCSSPRVLKHLKADFNHPLPLDKPFQIKILARENDGFEIQSAGNQCHLHGQFYPQGTAEYWSVALPDTSPPAVCRELSFAEAAATKGSTPLYVNLAELQAMFPHLATLMPPAQVAEILATTRLTGMDCPGLHTIFHSLDLHFECNTETLAMRYGVCRSDERFSVLKLAVESYGLHGDLSTFFRPAPIEQPAIAEAAKIVRPDEFQHVRALIVGGSRGLGELTAKLIAAGGGDVGITYNRGCCDAQRVANEIGLYQGKCRCFTIDVTHPAAPCWRELLRDWLPTHLFYFATPHIGSARPNELFSFEHYATFSEYYLAGFCRILDSLGSFVSSGLKIFYPSTTLIDTPENGQEEYIAAKSAGELLCRYCADRSPRLKFHIPRLPRMRTDQTAGIRPRRTADALQVMLDEIRRLEAK